MTYQKAYGTSLKGNAGTRSAGHNVVEQSDRIRDHVKSIHDICLPTERVSVD